MLLENVNQQAAADQSAKNFELRGKPVHVRPSLYALYFEELKKIAIEHGYNLCIHGSMNRDFDLVAFHWAEVVKSHFEMVEAMRNYIGGQFNVANNEGDLCATGNGFVRYVINLHRSRPFTDEVDQQYYFDIKVFPPPESSAISENVKEAIEILGTINFSSHNQMREAIESALDILQTARGSDASSI